MKVPQLQIVPSPRETEAMLARGLKCFEAGALAEAESLFRRCLQARPNIPMALRGLAAVQFQNGKREEAAKLLERAVTLEPDNLDAWANLAAAQASLQRFDDACRSFQRAIELSPGRADLHYGLGRVLRRAGRLEDAVAELALAAASAPQEWKYERTLGDCLRALARPTEAAAAYRRAMGIDPSQIEIALALGSLYRQEGHFHRALAVYRRILRRHRDHAGVWFNMAAVLFDLDRLEEAIDAYRHALAIDPNLAEAHRYIGNILQKQGRNDEARASFAAAAAIEPDSPTVVADAFYRAYLDCDWDSVGRLREKADRDLRAALDEGHEPAMSAHAALFVYDDPALHRAIAVAQAQRVQRAIPADQIGGRRRLPESEGPLNIGYLSGDIGDHPVSHLTRGLFGAHDRNAVSVTLYAFGADDQSEYRRAIVDSVDRFVDVTTLNDRAVAQQIAADRIDILVDLNGQTGAARMGIPARRPAPLQAVWLGYPGTGGGDWADFIIADAFVAPPSEAHHYVERLCLLPHSYLVTDDRQPIAKGHLRRADMGLPEDGFVFASFNNSYKIGADLFDTWMRILGAVEDSVLWLPEFDAAIRERLTRAAHDRGIDPARLIFANRLPKEWHLKRIGLADLGLDTLAYNGHTTTADALWAGLPVLTATGRSFARRVSGSLLRAIGVPELITGDLAAYEAAAIALAKDRERLLGLRQRIEANRSTAPLFDTARFARNLEGAYRAMRRAQRDGESRTPILVREEDGDE